MKPLGRPCRCKSAPVYLTVRVSVRIPAAILGRINKANLRRRDVTIEATDRSRMTWQCGKCLRVWWKPPSESGD